MKAAQQRLDAELAAGSEPQLEDSKGPEVSQSQESPKIPEVEKDLGREEGPRGSRSPLPQQLQFKMFQLSLQVHRNVQNRSQRLP